MLPELFSDSPEEVYFSKAFVEKIKHFIKIKNMQVYWKERKAFFSCNKMPIKPFIQNGFP